MTTIEYESVLISDLKGMLERIAPQNTRGMRTIRSGVLVTDTPICGQRCSVPGLSVPFSGDRMQLWTWQQIIFIDPDNRPRDRKLIVRSDPRGILRIDRDGMSFAKPGHGERLHHG